jgi:hypothetical protein
MAVAVALSLASVVGVCANQDRLTDREVDEAIALGKTGKVAPVRIAASDDYDVFIFGPITTMAMSVNTATKSGRPIDPGSLRRNPGYLAHVQRAHQGQPGPAALHIVLQPAKGAAIEPLREFEGGEANPGGRDAVFAHLPDGVFEIVVTTTAGPQRFSVGEGERATIR